MTNFESQKNKKIYLNDENDICRFCGKNKKEVHFSNICHAIPEFLGNKLIITKNECDDCNHYYGETIESDLGKFTSPIRTIAHVKGKNRIPIYKDVTNNKNTAKFLNGILYVENDNMVTIDRKNKKLCFNFKTEKVIPANVYKSLVRIALNCLPKKYFYQFKNLKWLNSREKLELDNLYTNIFFRIVPNIPKMCNIFLFIRKKNVENVPYCQMVLQSNNSFYQVILPFLNEDNFLNNVEITEFDFELENKKNNYTNIVDLSSEERINIQYKTYINYKEIR